MSKLHYHMPSGTNADVEDFVYRAITLSPRKHQEKIARLITGMGARETFFAMHGMRRWYSYNCWNNAKRLIPYVDDLGVGMNLRAKDAVGAYRGFKVPLTSELAEAEEGDRWTLQVERNRGCSSWTIEEKVAHRFAGKTRGKVALVVRLASPRNVTPFIAPPAYSEDWFNELYAATMNRSFRFNEEEYAIHGTDLDIEIVTVKR